MAMERSNVSFRPALGVVCDTSSSTRTSHIYLLMYYCILHWYNY